jgi:hypothetical protein
MNKLALSAAMLVMLAVPAFAQTHQRTTRQPATIGQSQALHAQAYAPRGFAYELDNERASMLSPGSIDYQTDYNR